MIDFQLLLCVNLELSDVSVDSISFSPVNLFLSIGYITGEVHIYSLIKELDEYFTELKKAEDTYNSMIKNKKSNKSSSGGILSKVKSNYKVNCNCLEEFENSLKKEKSTSLSLFSKIVNIKNYFFEDSKKTSFANLTIDSKGKHYISLFDKRNEITFITDSVVFKYKFSSAEGGRGWCINTTVYNDALNRKNNSNSDLFNLNNNSYKKDSFNSDDFNNDTMEG